MFIYLEGHLLKGGGTRCKGCNFTYLCNCTLIWLNYKFKYVFLEKKNYKWDDVQNSW